MTGTRGLEFLLDLENAVALARRRCAGARRWTADRSGGGRRSRCSRSAAAIRYHLVRVAWHLGNRHLPTQIMAKGLRIRRDHVIEAMVKGLGARVIEIEAPFDPEGGAYAGHAHADEMPRTTMPAMRTIMRRMTTAITTIIMVTTITMTSIATTIITIHDHSHAHDHK